MKKAKKRGTVVFIVAHPDDVAHAMGGTACLLGKTHEIHVLCATKGERGIKGKTHDEAAAIREKEEMAACKKLNAHLTFLGEIDGELFAHQDVCAIVAAALRRLGPVAVFTLWPINKHPDHVAAKAIHLSGISKDVELYMGENDAAQMGQFEPDLLVDITSVIDKKKVLIRAHKSQNPDETRVDKVIERNALRARNTRCQYVEAFKTDLPLAIQSGFLSKTLCV